MATSKILKDMETVYSTEETVIGTWTNSKPIYRKCFTGINFGTTTNTWTNTGITIPNVEYLVSCKPSATALPLIPLCGFRINNNNLQYYCTTSWQNTYNVVVEYTKTTD